MKISHLIYTRAISGAEKYLLNLLPGLKQYNIECDLICVCPVSSVPILTSYCETMNKLGVKTTLISGSKKKFLFVAKTINNYLKEQRISIIHSHLSNADLIAVLIKIIYNKKIFIISSKHGYDEKYLVKYSVKAYPHIIDRNIYYYFTKFLLRRIDVNLSISRAMSDLYFNIKLTTKPYHYIHHGIDEVFITENTFQKIPYQLIIIGRLEKMKGHKYLLNAMPYIISEFRETRLLILGEGSEERNLKKQSNDLGINKHVSFMGFQADPYTYILQSQVIVLPSLFEPFGNVYLEGFALKIPIVAFDVPAANELITDNETGMLAPKFNSEILAQKIIFLLQNPGEGKRISANAYQIYLQQYTSKRMIAETAAWYKSIIPYSA